MDKDIHKQLSKVLATEFCKIMDYEKDIDTRLKKTNTIFNLKKILDNYDELEPILIDYFSKKSEKDKWERS